MPEPVQVTLTAAPFEQALASYKAAPNPHTLLSLNKAAIGYMVSKRESVWKPVASEPLACDFAAIRVVVDRALSADDVGRLSGCLAYALTATLAGDTLGEPSAEMATSDNGVSFTCIEYAYNAASTVRTNPDAKLAFKTAREYIRDGTPVRTTDREGAGTRNTRLVEGISAPANVSFFVR